MRKLLTLAIPLLLGVGVLTAAIHSDPQSGQQSKRLQAGVAATRSLPPGIEETAPPAPATTATTAAPATTTTTAAPPPTTTPAPATTTTTPQPKTTTPTTGPPRA